MRRGLTLVEVVVATALLAMMVAALAPVVRGARRDLAASGAALRHTDDGSLGGAVDVLLAERPGLVSDLLARPGGVDVRWVVGERRFAATAEVLVVVRAGEHERRSSHCWVRFESGGAEAVRWLGLPRTRGGG